MTDINNITIVVGHTVKTTQPSGGIFNPAPPSVGIVEKTVDSFNNDALQIRFRKVGQNFDTLILLTGKINEILF